VTQRVYPRFLYLCVADFAGLMNVLAGETDVGDGGRDMLIRNIGPYMRFRGQCALDASHGPR